MPSPCGDICGCFMRCLLADFTIPLLRAQLLVVVKYRAQIYPPMWFVQKGVLRTHVNIRF